MIVELHPEAALEHEEQTAFYESQAPGLGRRYHQAFRAALDKVCDGPARYRLFIEPDIRRISLRGFPFSVFYRDVAGSIQILAIAAHRRRPGHWLGRL